MRKSHLYAVLALTLVLSLACLVYPIYVIRPFRAQGAGELLAALVVTRQRAWIAPICAAAAVLATIAYWRIPSRIWKRLVFTAGALAVCGFTALCRVNIYELMFHPNTHPAFQAARETKLDGGEKVIAIRAGGTARAYPIRDISYHHIINDVVGGVPIAATY